MINCRVSRALPPRVSFWPMVYGLILSHALSFMSCRCCSPAVFQPPCHFEDYYITFLLTTPSKTASTKISTELTIRTANTVRKIVSMWLLLKFGLYLKNVKILYIVFIALLNQYIVLNCPCNWFLCVPVWEMQSVQTVCGMLSALHTLLSLYFCASSTIMPFGWWCTGFFYVKGSFSYFFIMLLLKRQSRYL